MNLLLALLLAADWSAGPVLLAPGPHGAFDETAVKDPSIVFHNNAWHLFYTARGRGQYTLGYVTAPTLEKLNAAPRRQIMPAYAAAPQVFYFRPQKKWYLIFQTTAANYQPVFATSTDLATWSAPEPLIDKRDAAKWIDFWVLCDSHNAYLYFTRDHRDLYMAVTPLHRFPLGWNTPRQVFSPLHESAHIYTTNERTPRYLLFFETQQDDRRAYGLAEAATPAGPFREVDRNFAGSVRQPAWTSEISHGELIREGNDERLVINPAQIRFLIQGLPAGAHAGAYAELTWRLGLIAP
ncbi:MAG: hypothetical protein IPP47_14960 [Bryobacterales bacterium]|nr:hypothetical protein [Bryobacterales bacterium]